MNVHLVELFAAREGRGEAPESNDTVLVEQSQSFRYLLQTTFRLMLNIKKSRRSFFHKTQKNSDYFSILWILSNDIDDVPVEYYILQWQ